ncbi:MAG: Uncharacterised protein [Methanobacteriota archaeon]|nr:MAG: Uncharacterised protein [Euryarchaeota archaeon]
MVIKQRVPDVPIGCPRETAPPCKFNFSSGMPTPSKTAHDADANASLCSNTSTSSTLKLFLSNNALIAGIGAAITLSGCTPLVT